MYMSLIAPVLQRTLAWSVADVGTDANTNEKVLKAYTIPADMLNVNGIRLKFRYFGFFAATGNNKTIRLRLGTVTLTGTIVYTIGPTGFNNTGWVIEGTLTRRNTDAQDVSAWMLEDGVTVANLTDIQQNSAANDDAAAMLLELTGQNAAAAANDIVCSGHWIEWYAAPPA